MSDPSAHEIAVLYARFRSPIAALDCGQRCAPYNERGVPFCCDTRHAIPTAYTAEWEHLQANTDLWRPWEAARPAETARLQAQAPAGQTLIACQGHARCQREFRSITCRAFPFFPYLDRGGNFLGMSVYWEYEDRCWVISNLPEVTPQYRAEFIAAYDWLLDSMPGEKENFLHHSSVMRRVFARKRRAIPLLHRNGNTYKISPASGRMRRVNPERLPKFGPYRVAEELRFLDE